MKRNITILLCMLLFGIACVPTPKQEVIINRADGTMKSKLSAPSLKEQTYTYLDTWKETIHLSGVDVNIDAVVEVPEISAFPVVTFEKDSFTAEKVVMTVNALYPGRNEVRLNAYNREDILFDIQMLQRGEFADVNDETGEITWMPYPDEAEQLQRLAILLSEVSDEDEYVLFTENTVLLDGTQMVVRTENGTRLYVIATPSSLRIGTGRGGDIQSETLVWGSGGFAGEKPHALEHVTIDEQDAQELGEKILDSIGLANAFGVAKTEKARILDYIPEGFSVRSEGRIVEFARTAGAYIPYSFEGMSVDHGQRQEDTAYTEPWYNDLIQCYFDENGMQMFSWYYPNKSVRIANENAELLSFEEIQAIIRNQFRYSYAWIENAEAVRYDKIRVRRITLSCVFASFTQ